ncbi:MAG: glycosyltransferase family 4 protein [Bacteroidales bacterium]|nr:glycosyltransferase family 4 protein [Bacteroidales bacterium]
MVINCALVSAYMGPYPANYMHLDLALCVRMRTLGHNVVIVFPSNVKYMDWIPMFTDKGFEVLFVDYNPFSKSNINTFKTIFKEHSINIIYTQFCGWEYTVKLAAPNIPVIWHQLMNVNCSGFSGLRSWIKYNLIGARNTISIATSNKNYDAICSMTNSKKVRLLHDGIQLNRYKTIFGRNERCEPYNLLLFSHNPILKGLDIAYDACAEINKSKVIAELYVVSLGTTPEYIKNNYPELPSWFHILPPVSNLQEYYANADAYLCASRGEGFNNSIIEALYCGCSIIFSDIKTTRQIRQYKNVFEFKSESSKALSDAMLKANHNRISDEEIQFNVDKCKENHSVEKWINGVMDCMMELLTK